uniref:Uncharacterized protein n=1 Tax=Romanomermis culicivorax TaxID=13658 RepID=A0A915JXW8_ROMCU
MGLNRKDIFRLEITKLLNMSGRSNSLASLRYAFHFDYHTHALTANDQALMGHLRVIYLFFRRNGKEGIANNLKHSA